MTQPKHIFEDQRHKFHGYPEVVLTEDGQIKSPDGRIIHAEPSQELKEIVFTAPVTI